MTRHQIQFGFSRGPRGSVVDIHDPVHAAELEKAGLIGPPLPPLVSEARELAVMVPETKEGVNAAGPANTGRQRARPGNG